MRNQPTRIGGNRSIANGRFRSEAKKSGWAFEIPMFSYLGGES